MDLVAHSAELAADGTPRAPDDRHRFRGARRRRTGDAVRAPGLLRSGSRRWAANGYGVVASPTRRPGARRGRRGRRRAGVGAEPARSGPAPDDDAPRTCPASSSATASPSALDTVDVGIGVPVAGDPGPTSGRGGGGADAGTPAERHERRRRRGLDDGRRPARRPRRHPHRRVVARRLAARRPLRVDADRGPHRLAHAGPRAVRRAAAGASAATRIVVRSSAPGPAVCRSPRCGWSPARPWRRRPTSSRPPGPRRLTMVTCAGPYDAARGGYQNLAVVTARPVTRPASRAPAMTRRRASSRQAHPRRMPARPTGGSGRSDSEPSAVEHSIPRGARRSGIGRT